MRQSSARGAESPPCSRRRRDGSPEEQNDKPDTAACQALLDIRAVRPAEDGSAGVTGIRVGTAAVPYGADAPGVDDQVQRGSDYDRSVRARDAAVHAQVPLGAVHGPVCPAHSRAPPRLAADHADPAVDLDI